MLPALWEGHFEDSAEAEGDRGKACKPFSGGVSCDTPYTLAVALASLAWGPCLGPSDLLFQTSYYNLLWRALTLVPFDHVRLPSGHGSPGSHPCLWFCRFRVASRRYSGEVRSYHLKALSCLNAYNISLSLISRIPSLACIQLLKSCPRIGLTISIGKGLRNKFRVRSGGG